MLEDLITRSYENISLKLHNASLRLAKVSTMLKNIAEKRKEKRSPLLERRKYAYDLFVNEYQWPEKIAKQISKRVGLPREFHPNTYELKNGMSMTSSKKRRINPFKYIPGAYIANFQGRYFKPFCKLNNLEEKICTGINIFISDTSTLVWQSAVWYKTYASNYEPQGLVGEVYDVVGKPIFLAWLGTAIAFRAVYMPYRANELRKGNHTSSLSNIININPLTLFAYHPLFWYDRSQSKKEKQIQPHNLPIENKLIS
ncbi:MAG TPA: hypothetical protein VEC16_05790 [Alphaproteobacteria bacterium]|nr:hypothetical protein [Alphaproteobacteria bacterium]